MSHLHLINDHASGGLEMGTPSPRPCRGSMTPPDPQNGVQGPVAPGGSRVEPVAMRPRTSLPDDLLPAQLMLLGELQTALNESRRRDAARLHAAILVLKGMDGTPQFERALERIYKASGGRGSMTPPDPQNGVTGLLAPCGSGQRPETGGQDHA